MLLGGVLDVFTEHHALKSASGAHLSQGAKRRKRFQF